MGKIQVSCVTLEKQKIDWGLKLLNVPELWKKSQGKNVNVAVLDSGIGPHPDLKENLRGGVNFTTKNRKDLTAIFPHGTAVASVIGAQNNEFGIVGVAPLCNLWNVKVISDNGEGDDLMLIKGIEWCIENKMEIINMSLGQKSYSKALHDMIKRAYDANITMVAAAGNDGEEYDEEIDYPGRLPEVICVGAINASGKRANYSSEAKEGALLAPGSDMTVCSINTDGSFGYAQMSGTSFATPFIVGVLALIISKHKVEPESKTPIDTPGRLREHLWRTAMANGEIGKDGSYVYKIVNPEKFLYGLEPELLYKNNVKKELVKISPEEQLKQVRKTRPLAETIKDGSANVLKNADVGAGGMSYFLLIAGYDLVNSIPAHYGLGIFLLACSLVLTVVKHLLPEGPVISFLKNAVSRLGIQEKIQQKLSETILRKQ